MKYKAKKGDVIAIERLHSCHSIGFKRQEWKDWTLGRAHKVSRKGLVEQFRLGNESIFYSIDKNIRIATIADAEKRELAEKLLEKRGAESYESADALKAAILAN